MRTAYLLGDVQLDKAEAIAVLREIFTVRPEFGSANFVSLDPVNFSINSKGAYKIRLRVNLDSQSKDAIKPILNAHNLMITETKDWILIYRPSI